jgi:hypothetical protein
MHVQPPSCEMQRFYCSTEQTQVHGPATSPLAWSAPRANVLHEYPDELPDWDGISRTRSVHSSRVNILASRCKEKPHDWLTIVIPCGIKVGIPVQSSWQHELGAWLGNGPHAVLNVYGSIRRTCPPFGQTKKETVLIPTPGRYRTITAAIVGNGAAERRVYDPTSPTKTLIEKSAALSLRQAKH